MAWRAGSYAPREAPRESERAPRIARSARRVGSPGTGYFFAFASRALAAAVALSAAFVPSHFFANAR